MVLATNLSLDSLSITIDKPVQKYFYDVSNICSSLSISSRSIMVTTKFIWIILVDKFFHCYSLLKWIIWNTWIWGVGVRGGSEPVARLKHLRYLYTYVGTFKRNLYENTEKKQIFVWEIPGARIVKFIKSFVYFFRFYTKVSLNLARNRFTSYKPHCV